MNYFFILIQRFLSLCTARFTTVSLHSLLLSEGTAHALCFISEQMNCFTAKDKSNLLLILFTALALDCSALHLIFCATEGNPPALLFKLWERVRSNKMKCLFKCLCMCIHRVWELSVLLHSYAYMHTYILCTHAHSWCTQLMHTVDAYIIHLKVIRRHCFSNYKSVYAQIKWSVSSSVYIYICVYTQSVRAKHTTALIRIRT